MRPKHSIRLPVHGFVEFDGWERDVINHPVFQRLRRIRQLAFSEHVYPGSTHTRFEHSLGVMHVATRLYDAIAARFEAIIEDRFEHKPQSSNSRKLVRMAALLHDVGHAPFSHTGEELMPKKASGRRFTHEDYSAELIRHEMVDVIDNHKDNHREHFVSAADIADFYVGHSKFDAQQLFWRVLVNGQLDADRMDYLLRDSHHCGVSYGQFDLDRIIDTVALVANKSEELHGDLQIGVSDGGRHAAEGMILARYFMFQQVYFHHVRKAYDFHASQCLAQMLKESNGGGQLPDPSTECGRCAFLELDDWSVLCYIKQAKDDRHAAALLRHKHDRLVHRTHEVATPTELSKHEDLFEALKDAGLDPWVGDADKEWYKVDSGQIQIAPKSKSSLEVLTGDQLSKVSNVVQKIPESKQRLIFVPPEKLDKACEIKKKRRMEG
ncbi:MAG: HD domain-containing protein [Planctomycetes bacterium]|nr:HD domain-containing protein [Planctomycetota bacterium]